MPIDLPLEPPTSHLPPIANIKNTSIRELLEAVHYLRLLYNPAVRGSRCVGRRRVYLAPKTADVNHTSQPSHEPESTEFPNDVPANDNLVDFRAESFERSYAIRWLTSLVSQADRFEGTADQPHHDGDKLVQDAVALLAVCAGTASAGTVMRTFSFKSHFGRLLEVQVADAPLENHDFSSVGAQTWGSGCVLSEMIALSPAFFGLDRRPIRVLELGAGTGLVSLTIATVLRDSDILSSTAHTDWIIAATDFHPSVLKNLKDNIDLLRSQSKPFHLPIDTLFLDWSKFPNSPSTPPPPPFDKPFDFIFAADVVYETEQAQWIKNCAEILLRKPEDSKSEPPRFFLVVPVRPTHATESRLLERAFPFADTVLQSVSGTEPTKPTLVTISKEILHCEVGDGIRESDADLVQYAFYTIAWGTTLDSASI